MYRAVLSTGSGHLELAWEFGYFLSRNWFTAGALVSFESLVLSASLIEPPMPLLPHLSVPIAAQLRVEVVVRTGERILRSTFSSSSFFFFTAVSSPYFSSLFPESEV